MEISPLAGKPAPKNLLVDPEQLEREYYERQPDPGGPDQLSRILQALSASRYASTRCAQS